MNLIVVALQMFNEFMLTVSVQYTRSVCKICLPRESIYNLMCNFLISSRYHHHKCFLWFQCLQYHFNTSSCAILVKNVFEVILLNVVYAQNYIVLAGVTES